MESKHDVAVRHASNWSFGLIKSFKWVIRHSSKVEHASHAFGSCFSIILIQKCYTGVERRPYTSDGNFGHKSAGKVIGIDYRAINEFQLFEILPVSGYVF